MPDSVERASGRVVAGGVLLNYGAFFASKLIVFLNTVVLARLLAPEQFGLVAIGLTVVALTETIFQAGAGSAVVLRRPDPERTAAVSLAISLIGATIGFVVLFAMSPWLAGFFNEPAVADIIRVLAVSFLLTGPAAVFSGILQRRLEFGRRILPELLKAVAKGVVGISLAVAGFGVWSIVCGHLAGLAVGLGLLWHLAGRPARLSLDRPEIRHILPFTLHMSAVSLLGVATKNVDYVIAGRLLDPEGLGLYYMAFTLIDLVVMGICWSASQVFFPVISRVSHDPGAVAGVLASGMAGVTAVTVPASAGLALIAEPFMLTLFGDHWAAAIPVMQALAFYGLVSSLSFNIGDAYKGTGRPHVLTRINLVNLALAVPILVVASRWGILGLALGQILVATLITGLHWALVRHLLGVPISLLAASIRGPVLATAVMAVGVLAAGHLAGGLSEGPRMAVMICAGLAVYPLALWVIAPDVIAGARSLLEGRGKAPALQGAVSGGAKP